MKLSMPPLRKIVTMALYGRFCDVAPTTAGRGVGSTAFTLVELNSLEAVNSLIAVCSALAALSAEDPMVRVREFHEPKLNEISDELNRD